MTQTDFKKQLTTSKIPKPTVWRATWDNFEAFGLGKTQAREAVRLGVKMVQNRTGLEFGIPTDEDIKLVELKFGKPMQCGRFL